MLRIIPLGAHLISVCTKPLWLPGLHPLLCFRSISGLFHNRMPDLSSQLIKKKSWLRYLHQINTKSVFLVRAARNFTNLKDFDWFSYVNNGGLPINITTTLIKIFKYINFHASNVPMTHIWQTHTKFMTKANLKLVIPKENIRFKRDSSCEISYTKKQEILRENKFQNS